MEFITKEQTTKNVFEAAEDGLYLVIGKQNYLERLDSDMDGIFESERSWRQFIRGNFIWSEYGDLIDKPKETTLKKWCYDSKLYINKFCVKIGKDKYVVINSDDVVLEFDYELFYNNTNNFPSSVEFYVTGALK